MSFNKHQMNKGKKLMEDTVFFSKSNMVDDTSLSHVNDAGFWLVGSFLEINEIMETLIISLIISLFA